MAEQGSSEDDDFEPASRRGRSVSCTACCGRLCRRRTVVGVPQSSVGKHWAQGVMPALPCPLQATAVPPRRSRPSRAAKNAAAATLAAYAIDSGEEWDADAADAESSDDGGSLVQRHGRRRGGARGSTAPASAAKKASPARKRQRMEEEGGVGSAAGDVQMPVSAGAGSPAAPTISQQQQQQGASSEQGTEPPHDAEVRRLSRRSPAAAEVRGSGSMLGCLCCLWAPPAALLSIRCSQRLLIPHCRCAGERRRRRRAQPAAAAAAGAGHLLHGPHLPGAGEAEEPQERRPGGGGGAEVRGPGPQKSQSAGRPRPLPRGPEAARGRAHTCIPACSLMPMPS